MARTSKKRVGRCSPAVTPALLEYLEAAIRGKTNRAEATRRILGCSLSTAKRLTNRKRPYTSAFRREWASVLCALAGAPMSKLRSPRDPIPFPDALSAWERAEGGIEQLQKATDCGLAILQLAMTRFGLSGSMSVTHSGGDVRWVDLSLSPIMEFSEVYRGKYDFHKIRVSLRRVGGNKSAWFSYTHPIDGKVTSELLTGRSIRGALMDIYTGTKHITEAIAKNYVA